MTAYCLFPSYDDFDMAADIAMAITARKGQTTEAHNEIVQELRERFEIVDRKLQEAL